MQVVYEITQDPFLLAQYYRLRECCYRNELNLSSFDGTEEPADRDGHVFIARHGNLCLGGARLSPHSAGRHNQILSQKTHKDFGIGVSPSCFWERLAMADELRQFSLQQQFCAHLIDASWELGYDYAFLLSSVRNARFYRLCHSLLDVKYQIFEDIECTPEDSFSQLEHVLSLAHLRPLEVTNNTSIMNNKELLQRAHAGIAA